MPNQSDPNQNNPQPAGSNPPVIFPQSDLPPLPPEFQNLPKDNTPTSPLPGQPANPLVTGNANSGAPSDVSFTASKPKKKFGGGKIIATILGLVLLVGGVGAGILLTQRQQILKPKAETCPDHVCDLGSTSCPGPNKALCTCKGPYSEYCPDSNYWVCNGSPCDTPPPSTPSDCGNKVKCNSKSGAYCSGQCEGFEYCSADNTIRTCGIVTGDQCEPKWSNTACSGNSTPTPGPKKTPTPTPTPTGTPFLGCNAKCVPDANQCLTFDGVNLTCYESAGGNRVTAYCRNASCPNQTDCICPTFTPTPTPTPTVPPIAPSCIAVKAYNANWNVLTSDQLTALTTGDIVNFCVSGSTDGTYDKAQFEIGTTIEPETTTRRPGTSDFCQDYTILSTDTTVTVLAKIHDQTTNTWVGENF